MPVLFLLWIRKQNMIYNGNDQWYFVNHIYNWFSYFLFRWWDITTTEMFLHVNSLLQIIIALYSRTSVGINNNSVRRGPCAGSRYDKVESSALNDDL